ncbi:SHOCT domain-containing protein [Candidatus Pelagibacter sp.]|uniref:SHOCT domain-containing protein n=1 Tax=Candidatus Pelagibacter sp. TaxID=2024849 RepID=UPI003F86D08D
MEKIIFFGLALPILGFVFYLGGSAIMKGFKAKVEFAPKKNQDEEIDQPQSELDTNTTNTNNNLSSELANLNNLLKDGVLTQEEFDKAKKKILDN